MVLFCKAISAGITEIKDSELVFSRLSFGIKVVPVARKSIR